MIEVIRLNSGQANLVYELFNQYRIFYKQESNLTLAKDFIDARLSNNESVIFLAIDNENKNPAGFTQLYPVYSSVRAVKNWILNDLYVDAAYRKHGIGAKLIEATTNFARDNNATFIELSTAIDNYTAQRLYENTGFKQQTPDTEFYKYRKILV